MDRTFGIEEEFFLMDPLGAMPVAMSEALSTELLSSKIVGSTICRELLACQVEIVSTVCSSGEEALKLLTERRLEAQRICANHGLALLATGTPPSLPSHALVSHAQRYAQIQQFFPAIVREHYICGLHVHVHIPDRSSGVKALNILREWLPLLTAISANSPLWRGELSGFESWRTVHYRRWSVSGIPPVFISDKDYESRLAALMSASSVLDVGHIGWVARLSERHPTIEVRVADTQMQATESVAIALLIRALVEAVSEDPRTMPPSAPELLEISLWQAAKSGVQGMHFDARTASNITLEDLINSVLVLVGEYLHDTGDLGRINDYFTGLQAFGNGAQRQRTSWDRGGAQQVLRDASESFANGVIR